MQIVKLFAFLALIVSLLSGSAMGQSYGRRLNQYGRRLNQYGRRMNQYGRRLNQYGRRLNQYGRRMDWFSLDKIQKKSFFPWYQWIGLNERYCQARIVLCQGFEFPNLEQSARFPCWWSGCDGISLVVLLFILIPQASLYKKIYFNTGTFSPLLERVLC